MNTPTENKTIENTTTKNITWSSTNDSVPPSDLISSDLTNIATFFDSMNVSTPPNITQLLKTQ
jgi:hypothetical protein